MPRACAARLRFPSLLASAATISSRPRWRARGSGRADRSTAEGASRSRLHGRSATCAMRPWQWIERWSTTLRSSRTSPGQCQDWSSSITCGDSPAHGRPVEVRETARNASTRSGMSSRLSRRGGMAMRATARRYRKSGRSSPVLNRLRREPFVNQRLRTSTFRGSVSPTRTISRSSRARRRAS